MIIRNTVLESIPMEVHPVPEVWTKDSSGQITGNYTGIQVPVQSMTNQLHTQITELSYTRNVVMSSLPSDPKQYFFFASDLSRLLLSLGDHTQLDTHTQTHTHTHVETCSRPVISPSQRPPPTQHTANTTEEHICPQGIRYHDSSNRAVAELPFRTHDHRACFRLGTHYHKL
jgi:hypothetical protein